VKKIAFLSFGHWSATSQSHTRSAADVLLQSIDLAVAAEELGADGAYFRVHHFARQLSSPFPLLAAVGARTKRIEIGTGVIDMRYENPFYMVEDAGSADLIAGGRLQLGISRGSPEQVIEGWRHFGYAPAKGETDADMGRRNGEIFFELLKGRGFAEPGPRPMFPNPPGLLRLKPLSEGLRDRIWWGSASDATAIWAAKHGMNLQSSTLKEDESGEPFHVQQARQARSPVTSQLRQLPQPVTLLLKQCGGSSCHPLCEGPSQSVGPVGGDGQCADANCCAQHELPDGKGVLVFLLPPCARSAGAPDRLSRRSVAQAFFLRLVLQPVCHLR
jgi:alkanesulfonate monooxygenase SsuD/methylene tetrahydromethanopterin reductase-like flavin-dependent oxidoreductase (luciferase family)